MPNNNNNKIFTQVRECKANDKSKQHCFELYATGGAEIIKACKTDSEGKVRKQKNWNLNLFPQINFHKNKFSTPNPYFFS